MTSKQSVGKRDFIQHTSKYLKMAEHDNEIIITHHNEPVLVLSAIKPKSIKHLRGIITKIKEHEDINEPILPGFDQW